MNKQQIIPEWNYPDADHDYNPSWDYNIDINSDQKIVIFVENYLQNLRNKLLIEIDIIKNIKVGFITKKNNKDGMLGVYINGTKCYPVILLNIQNIQNAINEYDADLETQLEMSILHELGHAIQDTLELPYNEVEAEDFAFNYQFFGTIEKFWE